MTQISDLLEEKGFKSSEKTQKESGLSNWEIAQVLFNNLAFKCTHSGTLIEFKTTEKVITNRVGVPVKTIKKIKMHKIRLNPIALKENGMFLTAPALWVKPIIQNNRVIFFWKGQYIDGATIFGESINRYQ